MPDDVRKMYYFLVGIIFRFAVLLIFSGAAEPEFQEPHNGNFSEGDRDVYLIYSLMLTAPKTSHGPDKGERYLIQAMTSQSGLGQPCVRPPEERQAEFQEVLADYERRKGKPRELKPLFSIPKPYLLLNADDVKAFIDERAFRPGRPLPDKRFRGVTDLFALSDVYFNQRRTLALTGISTWCGSLCALWQWKVFEKLETGKWEERPWVSCISIADTRSPLIESRTDGESNSLSQ